VKGALYAALGLIALQVVVTSPQTQRIGGLLTFPATLAQHLFDPTIPALPDRSGT
jgi:hypothetical protein